MKYIMTILVITTYACIYFFSETSQVRSYNQLRVENIKQLSIYKCVGDTSGSTVTYWVDKGRFSREQHVMLSCEQVQEVLGRLR